MKYSLDTSAFLDGWLRNYPPETFKTLWDKLIPSLIESGDLRATDRLVVELERQDDDAHEWVKSHSGLIIPTDKAIQLRVRKILRDFPNLTKTYQRGTRSGGDPFVIALAEKEGLKVVAGEKASNNPNKPKIPDVCSALGIETLSFLELIQEQRWTF